MIFCSFSFPNFSQPSVSSFCLGPKLLVSTLVYRLPLAWETIFHIHTKQQAELLFCIFEIFFSPNHPDWLWGPPSLFNGYRVSFPVVQWPKRDVDHSLPSSTEVKNECSYTSTHHTPPQHVQGQLYLCKVEYLYSWISDGKTKNFELKSTKNFLNLICR
jgi:hypothetical protein